MVTFDRTYNWLFTFRFKDIGNPCNFNRCLEFWALDGVNLMVEDLSNNSYKNLRTW
jgi:hypothetical protein